MLLRKPLPLWISISLFAVAIAMVPVTGRLRHQPASSPRTLTALTEVLARDAPELYVFAQREGNLESGIYICMHWQSRERLFCYYRNAQVADTWQGIVHCERVGTIAVIEDFEIESWGEHGMQMGPFLFFGDPALLRYIGALIRDK